MIAVDASTTTLLFADPTTEPRTSLARAALYADQSWIVPEHWRAEVFSAIRGLWRGERLSDHRAGIAIDALRDMVVTTVPVASLLPRMWELRDSFSGYDAAYVALAELYNCNLVTADGRLARSGAARCPIVLIS